MNNDTISKAELTKLLRARRFGDLFVQLGWDTEGLPPQPLPVALNDGRRFGVKRVAEKRGVVACVCDAGAGYPRAKSDLLALTRGVARHHYEHLLIVCGGGVQRWQAAIRPQNRPLHTADVEWHEGQDVQPLLEKLRGLVFEIREEDGLQISDVVERVRGAFMQNAEKVTKKFYREFSRQLGKFSEFIRGIRDQVSLQWYAALMLNRLMFIYFIQKKRFLDDNVNYLEDKLRQTQRRYGKDRFEREFYRYFLRRLFSEGLGAPAAQRSAELNALLGKIPYLNGGLFEVHAIEKRHEIEIPDAAFENLFRFFGQYHWHLDSRPTASGKDINPDVIGYIFEKYINDRAKMGAYYTQEDITGYIARNTIIPFLLQRTREKCKNAFEGQGGIWRFLRDTPDNYIYAAVKKGCKIPDAEIPENIRRGLAADAPNLIARRADWNTKTPQPFALRTEIWRETIARRKRYFALHKKLADGEITQTDDLITNNLDLERFAADALDNYEGADFIAAFYRAIAGSTGIKLKANQSATRGISVLDPACGSGAFLFAALNILEPLYRMCLTRMREFVDADDARIAKAKKGENKRPKYPMFRAVLEKVAAHPNEEYWVVKSIVLNNLYGVDIMPEAAEIAKLRLFLRLAAVAEYKPEQANLGLEPLPDIDFNIRSGNSLVGFASMEQFKAAAAKQLNLGGGIEPVLEKATTVEMAGQRFREAQDQGSEEYREAKGELRGKLGELNSELNGYSAEQYGRRKTGHAEWLQTHQPFHWPAEFYGIVEENGGFDVVIGNPPYVDYNKIKNQYTVRNYETEKCGDLYAFFIERSKSLVSRHGRTSMIVPHSAFCTDRMAAVVEIFRGTTLWNSTYSIRPSKLFADAEQRLAIYVTGAEKTVGRLSTNYRNWTAKSRKTLFSEFNYHTTKLISGVDSILKIGCPVERDILDKLLSNATSLGVSKGAHCCYYHNGPRYWIRAMNFVPYFWNERDGEKQSLHVKRLSFDTHDNATMACALLNSSLFYWWFIALSNCRDLTQREINSFPFDKDKANPDFCEASHKLVNDLMASYRQHAERKETRYKTTGKVVYDEFYPRHSKAIIDKIDAILAGHYGFTEEELDYIINYDIKYRMGLGG